MMGRLREVVTAYWADRPMEQAAALSYYTLLSIAPLVLLGVAVASLVFERPSVESPIVAEVRLLIGHEGATVVETVLRNAKLPAQGTHSLIVRRVLLAVGPTSPKPA
jgi:membrane protein